MHCVCIYIYYARILIFYLLLIRFSYHDNQKADKKWVMNMKATKGTTVEDEGGPLARTM